MGGFHLLLGIVMLVGLDCNVVIHRDCLLTLCTLTLTRLGVCLINAPSTTVLPHFHFLILLPRDIRRIAPEDWQTMDKSPLLRAWTMQLRLDWILKLHVYLLSRTMEEGKPTRTVFEPPAPTRVDPRGL